MTDEEKAAKVEKVKEGLKYLFGLVREAKVESVAKNPEAVVLGGVLVKNPDGTGKLFATFEIEEFMSEVAEIVGYKSDPKEEDEEISVLKILSMLPGGGR